MNRLAMVMSLVALTACGKGDGGGKGSGAAKLDESRQLEAKLKLTELGKVLKEYFMATSSFPAAKAGPTPSEPCCKGPDGKCPVAAAAWAAEPWATLKFNVEEPSRFQYTYESDGKTVTVTAVGDTSCNGHPVTYKLEVMPGASTLDEPKVTLTSP